MTRFVAPLVSEFDINGNPLSGAKYEFFIVGTTTKKDTFFDEDLQPGNENTNPVIADASGTFPNIFLNGDYDVTLRNSVDALIEGPDTIREFLTSDQSIITFSTMTEASAAPSLLAGNVLLIKDRSNGTFDIISGTGTANTFNIVAHDTLSLSISLREGDEANVNSFGGVAGADVTAVVQAVQDFLTDGGRIVFEPNTLPYLITAVDITNQGITIDLNNGAQLKKTGSAGLSERGMFRVQNFLNARFQILGGVIDLNGEGPQEIDIAGRIANTYATAAGETGISGALNALIFALRTSDIKVLGTRMINSGENGLLFRNCANIKVDKCEFENIANAGVEFSLVDAGSDGGTGTMPNRGRFRVTNSDFKNIDDYKLGARHCFSCS